MENEFFNLLESLNSSGVVSEEIISEDSDLTYYELRRFLTLLFRKIKDKDTKKIFGEVLKALTVLELQRIPVPTVKKLKSVSPLIFGK